MAINTSKMILVENVSASKSRSSEFSELAREARTFLLDHKWCKDISAQWLAADWENLVVVFYFDIVPNSIKADDYVWVIVGDIPPAYIDIESARNPKEVLQIYLKLMNDWVQCIKNNESIENCYPVNVPPEIKYADMLATRIKLIREHILVKN